MTTPLAAEYKAVDPYVFGCTYFAPLGAANAIGTQPWNRDLPKPYRWISVVSNPRTDDASWPVIRVHTLAATFSEAAREAARTDDRAQVLVDYPGWLTTLPGGQIATCFSAEILEGAHEEPYAAETVARRFVSEFRFGFALVPAPV